MNECSEIVLLEQKKSNLIGKIKQLNKIISDNLGDCAAMAQKHVAHVRSIFVESGNTHIYSTE